ncbi:MAG: hypothetical protein BWY72_00572 [Bacteroidetes bacterium ADurb.Bin416]|nr:MAG: hypothetical protein BWY72_00572 [Bacteroidetes bacterium ADurb.Bin416]
MNIAGSRRQIKQEEIQFTPVGIGNQLLERVGSHASSPNHGIVLIDKEADGQKFHAEFFLGLNQVTAVDAFQGWPGFFHTEHLGDRGAENISIQQAYLIPFSGQRYGQVGGYGRFAYTTFSRGNRQDIPDLRQ